MIVSSRAAVLRPTTLDPSVWPVALAALRSLGFDAVDVPLVWREHDRGGALDLGAPRDLLKFFDLVAAEGFRAIVRLGPTCADDAPAMGVPDRLLRDPAISARTRRGNPVVTLDGLRVMPVPSFGSARWRDEGAAWVRAASSLLAPLVARGVVTAVVLGPAALRTLRDAPDDRDHHPDLPAGGEDPTETLRAYLDHLADAARGAGVADDALVYAAGGHALASPHTLSLAAARAVMLRAASPRWGVEGLWRLARLATTLPHGALLELHAGAAPLLRAGARHARAPGRAGRAGRGAQGGHRGGGLRGPPLARRAARREGDVPARTRRTGRRPWPTPRRGPRRGPRPSAPRWCPSTPRGCARGGAMPRWASCRARRRWSPSRTPRWRGEATRSADASRRWCARGGRSSWRPTPRGARRPRPPG